MKRNELKRSQLLKSKQNRRKSKRQISKRQVSKRQSSKKSKRKTTRHIKFYMDNNDEFGYKKGKKLHIIQEYIPLNKTVIRFYSQCPSSANKKRIRDPNSHPAVQELKERRKIGRRSKKPRRFTRTKNIVDEMIYPSILEPTSLPVSSYNDFQLKFIRN